MAYINFKQSNISSDIAFQTELHVEEENKPMAVFRTCNIRWRQCMRIRHNMIVPFYLLPRTTPLSPIGHSLAINAKNCLYLYCFLMQWIYLLTRLNDFRLSTQA